MKKYLTLFLSIVMAVTMLAIGVSAESETATFVNPVANGADPFVFKDDDGTYFMYLTSGGAYGYRLYTSKNLVEWEAQGYCLRREDVYTDQENNPGVYNFWAPEVIKYGDTYYMVYTAQEHIGIATSDSPYGPFKNEADSFLLPFETADIKTIDGHFFLDEDGKMYLYFVSTGAANYNGYSVASGNNIWGAEFDMETLQFKTKPVLLVRHIDKGENLSHFFYDDRGVVEGPEILKHNGTYYLTFSHTGFKNAEYSVWYATSSTPLGTYTRDYDTPVLHTDDEDRSDTNNPHLYGSAHHCFTKSPDDSETIIVYHAHRTGYAPNEEDPTANDSVVEERRICIDVAWFDEDGIPRAGTNTEGVPSATAQRVPSGAVLERQQHLDAPFDALASLPTVYVSYKDGNDEAAGTTAAAPLRTLEGAYAKLPNGGTIVLTQAYTCGTVFDAPAVNGPVMIKGQFSAVPLIFKFFSVNSDTYFDDIAFWPATLSNISVIECNFNNVVMGEGVSCIAQPTRVTFPVLVGGMWWFPSSSADYATFQHANDAEITSDKEYTIEVYSGTWSIATKYSVKNTTTKTATAPNSEIILHEDAIIRPTKAASAPTPKLSGTGAELTLKAIANAPQYVIYKDGKTVGYTTGTTFVDETYVPGHTASYSYAGYVNGACFGDESPVATFTSYGDADGDGEITLTEVINLVKDVVNGTIDTDLYNIVVALKYAIK